MTDTTRPDTPPTALGWKLLPEPRRTAPKIAVNVFTYRADAVCLGQCLRALHALGYPLDVYVWDDAANPLPFAPSGCHYETTDFPREGNLNGIPCVRGILFCLLRSARMSEADYVLKIDSDTCLLSLRHILRDIAEHPDCVCGYRVSRTENYISGGAYTIPARALYDMILALNTYESADGNYPEDRSINRLALDVGLGEHIDDHVFAPSATWWSAPFKFSEMPPSCLIEARPRLPFNLLNRYLIYDAVNFGNRHEIPASVLVERPARTTSEDTSAPPLTTREPMPLPPSHEIAGNCMTALLDFALPRLHS